MVSQSSPSRLEVVRSEAFSLPSRIPGPALSRPGLLYGQRVTSHSANDASAITEPTDDQTAGPLTGIKVVTIAVNLPGPAAAAHLHRLGASVVKVEPPSGDPMAHYANAYYQQMARGQEVIVLDLKTSQGQEGLWEALADADLLITSSRPSALDRLGLSWAELQARLPRLSQVAIVGHPGEEAEIPGHDLTYQAAIGTLTPPSMPKVLIADLAGAERATAEGLAAIVHQQRQGSGVYREVALSQVVEDLAQPLVHGLTAAGGLLGGGSPIYRLYACADGHIAVGALEPHFQRNLAAALELEPTHVTHEALSEIFATRTARHWQEWAQERDLPIAAVSG